MSEKFGSTPEISNVSPEKKGRYPHEEFYGNVNTENRKAAVEVTRRVIMQLEGTLGAIGREISSTSNENLGRVIVDLDKALVDLEMRMEEIMKGE